MDKQDVTHTRAHTHTHTYTMEYYSAIKNENFVICSNMNSLGRQYAKWNKKGRELKIMYDITYM